MDRKLTGSPQLNAKLPDAVPTVVDPKGGYFVWVELPRCIDASSLRQTAVEVRTPRCHIAMPLGVVQPCRHTAHAHKSASSQPASVSRTVSRSSLDRCARPTRVESSSTTFVFLSPSTKQMSLWRQPGDLVGPGIVLIFAFLCKHPFPDRLTFTLAWAADLYSAAPRFASAAAAVAIQLRASEQSTDGLP